MNTKFIQKAITSILTATILAMISLPVSAEPLIDKNKLDTATIHCSSIKDATLVDACKKGWNEGQSSCTTGLNNTKAIQVCIEAAQSRQSQPDSSQVVCNNSYPHTPGSNSKEENAFKACLNGYRKGDSICESYKNNTMLYDACILGSNGYITNEGSTEATISTPDEAASLNNQNNSLLGQAPQSSFIPQIDNPQAGATCSITGILGDIMCDGMNIFGQMADSSLHILGAFMHIAPFQTNSANPTFIYWSIFRNIANVLFILVFFIVIYSHLTGAGLNNYSVKRVLPRLIASALLVNISFYVCSILVDISNILGATINNTVGGIIAQSSSQAIKDLGDTSWQNIVKTTIMVPTTTLIAYGGAKAFITWGGFAALLPVVVSVFIAVATTVIALLLRQALVIVLTMVSPLAFLSIVLPNTKEWFDRWSRTFIPVLMLYPVVALLFAAGTTASYIIAHSVSSTDYPEKLFFIIMAMGSQIVPLFLIPKTMTLGGNMLSSFMGTSNAKTSSIKSKTKDYSKEKVAEGDIKSLSKTNNLLGSKLYSGRRKKTHRLLKNKAIKEALEYAEDKYILEQAENKVISNKENPKAIDNPTDNKKVLQKARVHAKEVEAKIKQMDLEGWSRDDRLNAAKNGDEAAIKNLMDRGDIGATFELIKASGDKDFPPSAANAIANNLEKGAFSNDPLLNNYQVWDDIRSQKITADNFHKTVVVRAVNRGDISADSMINMTDDSLNEIYNGLAEQEKIIPADRDVNPQRIQDIFENASTISTTNKLDYKVGRKYKAINDLVSMKERGSFQ